MNWKVGQQRAKDPGGIHNRQMKFSHMQFLPDLSPSGCPKNIGIEFAHVRGWGFPMQEKITF